MTDTPETQRNDPTEEHPLSLLLFAPLRSKRGQTTILWALVAICLALTAIGFFVKPGYHFPAESIPVFYGLFGAAAFTAAVLSGWPLGKWLRRPEGFYENRKVKAEEDSDTVGEANPDA